MDIDELKTLADENNKDAQYQLSTSYYRDTSLAKSKNKSKYSFEKTPEEDK